MNGSCEPSRIPDKMYRFNRKAGVQLTLQYEQKECPKAILFLDSITRSHVSSTT